MWTETRGQIKEYWANVNAQGTKYRSKLLDPRKAKRNGGKETLKELNLDTERLSDTIKKQGNILQLYFLHDQNES